jgi:hypothetical protein
LQQGAGFVFSGPSPAAGGASQGFRFVFSARPPQAGSVAPGRWLRFFRSVTRGRRPVIARVWLCFFRPSRHRQAAFPRGSWIPTKIQTRPFWNQSVARPACSWTRAFDARPFSSPWVYGPPLRDDLFFQVPSPARMRLTLPSAPPDRADKPKPVLLGGPKKSAAG